MKFEFIDCNKKNVLFLINKKDLFPLLFCSILSLCSLTSCFYVKTYAPFESGIFTYAYIDPPRGRPKEHVPIAILDVDFDKIDEDYFFVPREIDGYPVRQFGANRYFTGTHNPSKRVWINDNIKKIYLHEKIYALCAENDKNTDVYVCGARVDKDYYFRNYYLYKKDIDKLDFEYDKSRIFAGNVEFMNNYPNELEDNYYSLDNIKDDELINVPPEPKCEGYNFTGWYTEPECIKKFDFSISPTIEENKIFRLYAGWNR